ncbi:MAG TPA: efflux RND transporter periplasmic adaptor subunit [Coleofasciculaceae cyanobacterium]|jgi:RND family efflux transporter MFP subunit
MAKAAAKLPGKSLSTVLIIIFLTAGACSRSGPPPGAGKPPPAFPVKLQNVETSTAEESSEFLGTLQAAKIVVVKTEADGKISQILASEGSPVGPGTTLVQISPDKRQAQVGGAIANVNASVAAQENASAQLEQAKADRASALADLELSSSNLTRISTLVSQGAFPQQQLDQAKRNRDADLAKLRVADKKIQAAQASLGQAQASLQEAKANASLSSEQLRDTRVTAPIAGVVGTIPLKLGDYVKVGDTITTIVQNDTLDLSLKGISADQASQLRLGLPVQLNDPNTGEPLATGRISFVSPQVNSETQSVLAKASFSNPEGTLRDAQNVKARVIWNRKPGISIPTTAISRVAGQDFVYVAQTDGQSKLIARQKPVKLGEIKGNNYQVIEGLKPGEKIIVSGTQNLSDSAPIIPQS